MYNLIQKRKNLFDRHITKFLRQEIQPIHTGIIITIFFLAGAISIPRIQTLTEASDFFPEKEGVRGTITEVSQKFLGLPNIDANIKASFPPMSDS